ncbi:MAG: SpaA isopeptide-forming pilin-related protein [Bacilli bacterium]|nr:SpaA isopeptide-forming pilin-related protein [Bacilli bacterium]
MRRIEKNQRKSILKLKGFKQALSLIMILFMCLVLLPMRPTEAAGQTYTVYFDASGNTNAIWNINDKIYVYGYNSTDDNSGIMEMTTSSRGENLWEFSFDKQYTNVIFLKSSDFPSGKDQSAKTIDLSINWFFDSPCFKLNGYYDESNGGAKKGDWRDLGPNTKQGSKLGFVDMTGSLSIGNISAVFAIDESFTKTSTNITASDGKFTVPNDTPDGAYQYVRFKNGDNYITGKYKVTSSVTDGTDININERNSVLYYGVTEKSDGTKYSYWGKENTATSNINNKKLYLEKSLFNSTKETYIQIGSNLKEKLNADSGDSATLSYTINNNTATQKTIITIITSDNTKYHFFWSDLSKDLVTISNNAAVVSGTYSKTYTIYFDATLSKLSYAGDQGGNNGVDKANREIPNSDGKVWCHVWKNDNTSIKDDIEMTKVPSYKNGNNIWNDVYKVDLDPNQYDKIIFYSTDKLTGDTSAKTEDLDIPTNLSFPCFYADSSDDIIYSNSVRKGYWNEVYTIRNPELEGKEKSNKEAEKSIVDIDDTQSFVRNTQTKYVNTTFYDFYTDYELNGNDRDSYNLESNGKNINTHRIYQPFNQFNQALSSYYKENQATDPIYWGNFQNYPGSKYSEIGQNLDLYGYDKSDITSNNTTAKNKFFYEHHSMWGADGQELTGSEGKNAVLDLVNPNLDTNGNLQINTNNGTELAPYFNESFLEGNNAKNTVLGKVYKDVEFPFTKKPLKSQSDPSKTGTVDYWEFNSADTSLEMKKDASKNEYYLKENNAKVCGQKPEGTVTTDGNFFPFNKTAQSGKATQLNYGFAMKLQFDFKLTDTKTVKTSKQEEVPIEFNFSGDDDVWIFIDGKLALDIGGGHGVVSGTLNFKDKTYNVSRIKNPDPSTGGTTDNYSGDFTLDDTTKSHTLTMFYMERGLWESNMRVTFNFPDENKLQVEKQVDVDDVKDEFKSCFDNANKMFSFNIKNQVTSYGAYKPDDSGTSQQQTSLVFNDSFTNDSVHPATGNVFEHCSSKAGNNNVAHGNTGNVDDPSGSYIDKRLGIIERADKTTLNISNAKKYLQFDFYFDDAKFDPLIANMYVELEDSSGQKINGWLSSQNVESTLILRKQTWHTILVNIDNLTKKSNFDFNNLKYVKFGYKYRNDIYLDNIIFKSEDVKLSSTGFQVDESKIRDYGSAESGKLENAKDALFELNDKDNIKKVDSEGNFLLGNNDTATFINQFRRGSYISLTEEVNPDVFSTKWTLYENGGNIQSYGTGSTITNPENANVSNLKENDGLEVDDGRIANVPKNSSEQVPNNKYAQPQKPSDNTIVFRSYSDPDDDNSNINLKAVFVNTVRTGNITIKKEKAYTQEDLAGTYKFKVTFTNVAGMALEGINPIVIETDPIAIGGEYTISGIPAGTTYCIEEVIGETDDFRVDSIDTVKGNDKNITLDSQNMTVTGVVVADENDTTKSTYTFKNTKHEKIAIDLEKKWQNESGNAIASNDSSLPQYIDVQLQRRVKGTKDAFTIVQVDGKDYVRIVGDYTQWEYTFRNLDKSNEYGKDYEYRIVEVEVKVNDEGEVTSVTEKSGNIILNDQNYQISGGDVTNSGSEDNPKYTAEIINKRIGSGSIEITKVDFENQDTKLIGAEFTIKKLVKDDAGTIQIGSDKFKVDTEFEKDPITTSDQGIATFNELDPGFYQIEETEAPEGYVKLNSSFIIELSKNGDSLRVIGDKNDGKVIDSSSNDNKPMSIKLNVLNPKGVALPLSGLKGIQLYLLIGVLTMLLSAGVYTVVKVRKSKKIS